MAAKFVSVESDDQINRLADLAEKIWREYWPDIIGQDQTEYMIEKFQSGPAIRNQIGTQGYEYFFIEDDGETVGFIGMKPDGEKLFLSKLYLDKSARGRGYSSQAFEFLQDQCQQRDLEAIWLTVNKNNKHAIDVYKVKGFETVRQQTTPIGEGYVMDDFVMELPVES